MMKDDRIKSLAADFFSSERSFVLITRVSASAVRLRYCFFPQDIVCPPAPALDFRTPLSRLRPRSDLGPLGLFPFDLDATSPTRTPTNLTYVPTKMEPDGTPKSPAGPLSRTSPATDLSTIQSVLQQHQTGFS
ncbi:uncharacterized protein [Nerophis lumbriciformis]|uniref:uncharacterized protein isoform X4 n=1 Tax=Nerophis lumbriciformis TaxID=546530 RepID=UPI002AE07048|nr:uncharacterized protein LOC133616238 isoform X4 [Nerophis lumbriciformis]